MSQDSSQKQLETIRTLTETFEDIKCDLDGQYQISHLIGSGAYGSVWKATSFYTSGDVAVKRIKNKKHVEYCLKRTLREIKILRHFKHGNIVSLHDVIMSSNESSLYLVLDLMETDLHKIIQSPQPLSVDHVKWFLYQLLRALKYLHSANVVHRDIKPSNLLVNSNCLLKLADFGMARCLNDLTGPKGGDKDDTSSDILSPSMGGSATNNTSINSNAANTKNGAAKLEATIYVATRWYRSPELILCHAEYTTSIDMWSVGCILAELLLRRPLFPGKSQVNQLNLIISVLGHPRKAFVDKIKSDPIKAYMNSMVKINRPISLREKIPNCNSKEALDLIQRLLIWEPNDRLPSELALAHSFIVKHHRPAEEPICCKDYDYAFENSLVGADQLNEAVAVEIQKFAALRKRKMKKKFVSSTFSNEAEKEANKIFPQRNSNLWQNENSDNADSVELTEDSAALAKSKKEHSLEVKAKLRAAILSDEWRSKGKRRTRTGRPKNSKVTKKKVTESVLSSNKRNASNLSTVKETPSLTKEEIGTFAQMKSNNRPITVKIVTAGNANEGTNKRQGNVLTLSFSSPKAQLVPKQGRFVVPKVTNSKTALIPVMSNSNKDSVKAVVHRGGLLKNVTITSKMQPRKVLKPNVIAVPANPTPKVVSIPKVIPCESVSTASSNHSNSTTSGAQILPQQAFRFKAVTGKISTFHAQPSENSILLAASCTTTASNAQNLPSIMEVYSSPKNNAANIGESGLKTVVNKQLPSSRLTSIPSIAVSSIPIDHSSYPVSFKTSSLIATTPAGNSNLPTNKTSIMGNRSGINKMPISSNVRPITLSQTPRIQPAPNIRYKPALRGIQASNSMITQPLSPEVSASKVPMFIEDDDDDDDGQHIAGDIMANDDVREASLRANGIAPCLRLPSMALMDNGDVPMVSAVTLSQKSSASTVPGNDNEMEDLIHKLSSSSLRNDINPFAEFLDIPLSAVLTANEDKSNEFLPEKLNDLESSPQYSVPGGGTFIPEPHNVSDDRLFTWNDGSCNQTLGLTIENLDDLTANDCRSIFDITSAEMQEIENELKKDFSCLDFSLLELDSPT